MRLRSEKSARRPFRSNELGHALILRDDREESAPFPCPINDLHLALVLRGREEDSAHLPEKPRTDDAKRVLSEIPGKGRERRRQTWWIQAAGAIGGDLAAVQAMPGELVRMPASPRGLGPQAPRRLTTRGRAHALARPDVTIGNEPSTADAARTLPRHPQMLDLQPSGGHLLARFS